jgi:transcriptional regulator with XRE-family HTH domain
MLAPASNGMVCARRREGSAVATGSGADGFGDVLRTLRERALLTQEQLAERSGLSVRTIRRLERGGLEGRPQSGSLRRLITALGAGEAEQALLAGAVAGEEQAAPAAAEGYAPRQLPLAPPQFVGRGADLAVLDEARAEPGPVIIAIDGMAGVGKTAFAVHAAHRWARDHPDGQLFLDLQGYARGVPPVEPGDALHRLLRSLGVAGPHVPDDVQDRAALFRSLLADRRVLLLLDNAASEAQVVPLLPASPGCLVVITSRSRLTGLDVTRAHSLDLLPADDAVALFVRSCGRNGSPDLVAEAVEMCGRLPLAIRLAGARLRSRPSWTAAHLVDRLRDARYLTELEVGDRSVGAALELSYVQLDEPQRRAYRLLALHPGVETDLGAAAALVGGPEAHTRRVVDHLLDVHLLQEPAPGRYRFHDLTRGTPPGRRTRRNRRPSAGRRSAGWWTTTAGRRAPRSTPRTGTNGRTVSGPSRTQTAGRPRLRARRRRGWTPSCPPSSRWPRSPSGWACPSGWRSCPSPCTPTCAGGGGSARRRICTRGRSWRRVRPVTRWESSTH